MGWLCQDNTDGWMPQDGSDALRHWMETSAASAKAGSDIILPPKKSGRNLRNARLRLPGI
ncbi:hypothetical protein GCM10009715_40480 [Paeniglutamicibacter psychrophenolicus]